MSAALPSSAGFHFRCFTTTRRWQWRGSWPTALLADLDTLRDLPGAPFEACEHVPGRVSRTGLAVSERLDALLTATAAGPGAGG